jgi:hypothetical protein
MYNGIKKRFGLALCLASALALTTLGCHPASTGTNPPVSSSSGNPKAKPANPETPNKTSKHDPS